MNHLSRVLTGLENSVDIESRFRISIGPCTLTFNVVIHGL